MLSVPVLIKMERCQCLPAKTVVIKVLELYGLEAWEAPRSIKQFLKMQKGTRWTRDVLNNWNAHRQVCLIQFMRELFLLHRWRERLVNYHRPPYHLSPSRQTNNRKNKGNTNKSISRKKRKKRWNKYLDWAKSGKYGEDRRSNSTIGSLAEWWPFRNSTPWLGIGRLLVGTTDQKITG